MPASVAVTAPVYDGWSGPSIGSGDHPRNLEESKRPMKRTFVLALLLGAFAFAGDKQSIKFRLKKDPEAPMRGWCIEYDDKGFLWANPQNHPVAPPSLCQAAAASTAPLRARAAYRHYDMPSLAVYTLGVRPVRVIEP